MFFQFFLIGKHTQKKKQKKAAQYEKDLKHTQTKKKNAKKKIQKKKHSYQYTQSIKLKPVLTIA